MGNLRRRSQSRSGKICLKSRKAGRQNCCSKKTRVKTNTPSSINTTSRRWKATWITEAKLIIFHIRISKISLLSRQCLVVFLALVVTVIPVNFAMQLIYHIIHLEPDQLLPLLVGPIVLLDPHFLLIKLIALLLF